MRSQTVTPAFQSKVDSIVAALRKKDLSGLRENIAQAMAMDMDAPEPHNLLGIHCELTGDLQAARKHYRAAYALDPTYKPCCRNLERITSFDCSTAITDMDFGTADENRENARTNRDATKQLR